MTRTRFQFISSCLNPHGIRAVQKLFEYITTQQQIFMFLSALNSGAVALATDPNGHHVIQHCLIRFFNEDNKQLCGATFTGIQDTGNHRECSEAG
ncbi:putative pumilio homolog 10 [Actinidia eriantha]|uniref:putative pumilio homolog 10 n=1 Tax=Actinidia eriantha TaxID=165200 RepID=UPI002589AFA2|nr:putative pumilio homolog 10 [Actinidia eriantha]